ncbi:MAG: molecular chaperone TorD family protein [Myxococcota bacterium]
MQATEEATEGISLSLDRARVYRALAQLFRRPDADSVQEARERNLPELCEALGRLTESSDLVGEAEALRDSFAAADVERLRAGHHTAFDESSSARCAPTEMDQLGGAPQLELTRTFEMADVAGFYSAFGVEVEASGERSDHITAELEFMHLLAVKEWVALQEEGEGEHAEICRNASRAFLRDHLARWAPRLGECLEAAGGDPVYRTAGRLLGGFVAFDAERLDVENAPVHRLSPERRADPAQSA